MTDDMYARLDAELAEHRKRMNEETIAEVAEALDAEPDLTPAQKRRKLQKLRRDLEAPVELPQNPREPSIEEKRAILGASDDWYEE